MKFIQRHFRSVWSDFHSTSLPLSRVRFSFSVWRNFASLTILNVSSDQTARMCGLNCIFAGRTCLKAYFLTVRPKSLFLCGQKQIGIIKDQNNTQKNIITKTRLFKYTENFTTQKWKFSDKKSWCFSYFCSKHRLWVLVRTSTRRF